MKFLKKNSGKCSVEPRERPLTTPSMWLYRCCTTTTIPHFHLKLVDDDVGDPTTVLLKVLKQNDREQEHEEEEEIEEKIYTITSCLKI